MFIRNESFREYRTYYPVVFTLLVVTIAIHIIANAPIIGVSIYSFGVGQNGLVAEGEYWRLITPIFLHGGFMHLLFNMFSLFLFGPELERLAGRARFLTIYFLSGLTGTVASFLFEDAMYTHLGASGAIYGIFGAFAALVYYTRNVLPQLKQIILPIIGIGIIMTFVTPNINITAHLGGLVMGFLLGFYYFHPNRLSKWKKTKPRTALRS
ncbi:rhomboid family intramembrane serine protease [Chryseomicrobium excrementi]|uniref:Rhomboid family intramembrane serine protease n=1 Tax=Chryseomicrobium excrementi TaxID=2041346 RepID=A0A2M9EX52_9BACL|nr:rhomboid family intramembrane serine protease [Chryseomicrobium excrementi]PJK15778.1 rhomboid family intramembrane serine protease [Chryseomicrobium excrementi]